MEMYCRTCLSKMQEVDNRYVCPRCRPRHKKRSQHNGRTNGKANGKAKRSSRHSRSKVFRFS